MKNKFLVILTFAVINSAFADTTWIEDDYCEGVFDVDGNPYVIREWSALYIGEGTTLEMRPGVVIVFEGPSGILNDGGTLIAHGSPDDSIVFRPPFARTEARIVAENRGHTEFKYCRFYRMLGVDNGEDYSIIINLDTLGFLMENCTMEESVGGLYLSAPGTIRDCHFKNLIWGIQSIKPILFEKCTFNGDELMIFIVTDNNFSTVFQHCMFYNYRFLAASGVVFIKNCIFIDPYRSYFIRNEDDAMMPGRIINNCFFGHEGFPFRIQGGSPDTLTPLGVIRQITIYGDSTDIFGNLFQEPGIVEGWEWGDEAFLREDSPCIDAGSPASPLDPDSTIADIGPFFFSQPNIAVPVDSFAFVGTELGDSDTLFFSITNYGDQRDLRYFLDEEAMDRSFRVLGWEGDTTDLAAGDSVQFGLIFRPREAREYLDTLRIFSNDRDEDLIALPVRGVVANFVKDLRLKIEDWGLISVSPNPFNSSVTISFSSSSLSSSSLRIYDLSGRLVADLLSEHPPLTPPASGGGKYSVVWNAGSLPSAVYIVRLESGGNAALSQKVVLMR